jgi:hypothetical protein
MQGTPLQIIQWLYEQDKDKQFTVKEHKEKRSLNANNYYWQLVNQIANKLHISKEEVHERMIKRYSQSEYISVLEEVNISGYIRYLEEKNTFIHNGRKFKSYLVFKGSSEMDTKEMSILIDGIVSEAKEMGIETLTPDELARLEYIENASNTKQ